MSRAYGVLASVLDVAVRDRRLSVNPARGVNLPRKTGKRHIYLTHQQVELLARGAGEKGALVRFLCYTGLRWGEATALLVRDLDLSGGRVTVVENAVRVNGRIVVGTPKSHPARAVPIPPFLIEELRTSVRAVPGMIWFSVTAGPARARPRVRRDDPRRLHRPVRRGRGSRFGRAR